MAMNSIMMIHDPTHARLRYKTTDKKRNFRLSNLLKTNFYVPCLKYYAIFTFLFNITCLIF